ncbi:MAG: hypothetical protein LBT59_11345 [Clostridiales bacterium]|jgi:DNA repair exonuclease SbcCD ATPase subunit|nr:hypothetical protein [Clostridiales bacterium]
MDEYIGNLIKNQFDILGNGTPEEKRKVALATASYLVGFAGEQGKAGIQAEEWGFLANIGIGMAGFDPKEHASIADALKKELARLGEEAKELADENEAATKLTAFLGDVKEAKADAELARKASGVSGATDILEKYNKAKEDYEKIGNGSAMIKSAEAATKAMEDNAGRLLDAAKLLTGILDTCLDDLEDSEGKIRAKVESLGKLSDDLPGLEEKYKEDLALAMEIEKVLSNMGLKVTQDIGVSVDAVFSAHSKASKDCSELFAKVTEELNKRKSATAVRQTP